MRAIVSCAREPSQALHIPRHACRGRCPCARESAWLARGTCAAIRRAVRFAWALLLVAACTVGAAGRMELSYDGGGAPDVRASAQGGVGITSIAMPETASRQTVTFILLSVGVGWGTDGGFLTVAVEGENVPPPGEGSTGIVAGYRMRISPRCVHWAIELGGARLIEQTHADDRSDEFGPNPSLTRAYQDANGFVGWDACDDRGSGVTVGAAYDVGIAKLIFAPGP